MHVEFSKTAVKALQRLDKRFLPHMKQAIEGIPQGDIKPMEGTPKGRYRLRVGAYRVIFRYDGDTVVVLDVGSRGDVYK